MAKLTDAQRKMLEAAARGGVYSGRGRSRSTEDRLRLSGLLSLTRDEHGYYTITDAGRAALRQGATDEA